MMNAHYSEKVTFRQFWPFCPLTATNWLQLLVTPLIKLTHLSYTSFGHLGYSRGLSTIRRCAYIRNWFQATKLMQRATATACNWRFDSLLRRRRRMRRGKLRTLNFNYKLVTVVASHAVYTFFPFHVGNQNASFIQV